jgi:AraC-like DNA-binding protein
MAVRAVASLAFQTLYESPLVRIRDYRCCAVRSGPAAEEHSDGNHVVLLRHGVFCRHFGRRTVAADVNQAVYFAKGSTYRVSHPGSCGDRGTIFIPAPRVLDDVVRELHPAGPEQPFPFDAGPCAAEHFWRHRELVQRLESKVPLEPLWADVTALQLVADVLEAAYERHGMPQRKRRHGTDAARAEQVEAARTYLASHLGERITLDDVASAVHCSPYHLARVFQERTGVPVHRYLTHLRLRAALERLGDGADDLTQLALDLGFASHSHFTDAFRREFGAAPSALRREAMRSRLRQLSKNLEV